MSSERCAACGEAIGEDELYCEACGRRRDEPTPASDGSAVEGPGPATAAGIAAEPTTGACPHCGAPAAEIADDGYCGRCGMRQPRAGDHHETDLGVAAAVSDRGLRHHRNEDAYAVASSDERIVAVVCDGVSTSGDPDQASATAARAAIAALEPALRGPWPDEPTLHALLVGAIDDAQRDVAGLAAPRDPRAPATTAVAAIVGPGTVILANVGDSRAYWLGAPGERSEALTVDDSCAQVAVAAGSSIDEAYSAPDAHTLTSWLGADASAVTAAITAMEVLQPGLVVLCSDGLWNHFAEPHQLLDLVQAGADRRPLAVARRMLAAALAAGGEDNITIVVISAQPRSPISLERQEPLAHADVHP